MAKPLNTVIFFAAEPGFETLSYHDQWVKAWMENPSVRPTLINLSRGIGLSTLRPILTADIIVFLHSTNSNETIIPNNLRKLLRLSRAKKIFFVGNEYKLIPEKLALLNELGINLICSQLPESTAKWLYSQCTGVRVASIAHALDPTGYQPKIPIADRPLDIGVRAYEYPWYLGDRDRAEIIETFLLTPKLRNLQSDISMDPKKRFTGNEWAGFLNRCRATISTEAGATFLQRDDQLRNSVIAYQTNHPDATFSEISEQLFKGGVANSISGKCLSSRHMEAIGTQTVQIMFPGAFNGILSADVHYIMLKRDYSNLDDVLMRLKDTSYLEKMTTHTREYCLDQHQHRHRVQEAIRKVFS